MPDFVAKEIVINIGDRDRGQHPPLYLLELRLNSKQKAAKGMP
jgi:hypothetical protein